MLSCICSALGNQQKIGFRTGLTKTQLHKHRRWLEAGNFRYRKKRNCAICVAKTKALISCAVTAQLICVFVFAYAKSWFSHAIMHLLLMCIRNKIIDLKLQRCIYIFMTNNVSMCMLERKNDKAEIILTCWLIIFPHNRTTRKIKAVKNFFNIQKQTEEIGNYHLHVKVIVIENKSPLSSIALKLSIFTFPLQSP